MSHTIKPKPDKDEAAKTDATDTNHDIVDSGDHAPTPLEMAREQQAKMHNQEVTQQRIDPTGEVPGQSIPSDRRHHPQRQNNYDAG